MDIKRLLERDCMACEMYQNLRIAPYCPEHQGEIEMHPRAQSRLEVEDWRDREDSLNRLENGRMEVADLERQEII